MFELHAFLMIESISMEAVFRDDIISFANSAAAVVELIGGTTVRPTARHLTAVCRQGRHPEALIGRHRGRIIGHVDTYAALTLIVCALVPVVCAREPRGHRSMFASPLLAKVRGAGVPIIRAGLAVGQTDRATDAILAHVTRTGVPVIGTGGAVKRRRRLATTILTEVQRTRAPVITRLREASAFTRLAVVVYRAPVPVVTLQPVGPRHLGLSRDLAVVAVRRRVKTRL